MHVAGGVGAETDNAEGEKHQAAGDLEEEAVLCVVHHVHHETHAHAGDDGVDQVAQRRAHAGHHAIPATFVQGALYA